MNQEIENLWLKMNRRQALRTVGAGLGYMALGSLLAGGSRTAGKFSHHPARAKRIIYLFQSGGPLRSIFLIINQHSLSTTAVIFSNMLNNRAGSQVLITIERFYLLLLVSTPLPSMVRQAHGPANSYPTWQELQIISAPSAR